MTIEFPFEMGQVVQTKGENDGQVRGLWVDFDGVQWLNVRRKNIRYKDDAGVFEVVWRRSSDCVAV